MRLRPRDAVATKSPSVCVQCSSSSSLRRFSGGRRTNRCVYIAHRRTDAHTHTHTRVRSFTVRRVRHAHASSSHISVRQPRHVKLYIMCGACTIYSSAHARTPLCQLSSCSVHVHTYILVDYVCMCAGMFACVCVCGVQISASTTCSLGNITNRTIFIRERSGTDAIEYVYLYI